ncbi:hypothetical protein [Sulfurimonas sp.]|uniref:hypothetical protein n=1 Tax=Sulfurimonas sp. TaxID=2022749 RepID=UPI0025FE95D8|nr:hypothetical protein [Sulfurimonas sp.]
MDEEYSLKINDAGIQLSHPEKLDLQLDDIFIYQNLMNLDETDIVISHNASQFKNFENINRTVIFGAETSGKTSLAQMLQIAHKENGKIPIMLSGKIIKTQDYSMERIQKAIERAFKKQYSSQDLDNFRQEDKKNILIMVDDFNEINFNNEHRSIFVDNLNKLHENIIIFAHESLELEAFNDEYFAKSILDYSKYRIKPFGHKIRDKLIKQWILLGQEERLTNEEIHNIIEEKAKAITTTLGYNIVPAYPIFLLTLLQSMESNNTSTLSKSTYGHYYSYLITESLSIPI